MPISVTCPQCGIHLKAPDDRAGKRAKCTKCSTKFLVPGVATKADSVGDTVGLSVSDSQALETIKNPFSFDGSAEVVVPQGVTATGENPFAVTGTIPETKQSKTKLKKDDTRRSSHRSINQNKPNPYGTRSSNRGLMLMLGIVGLLIVAGASIGGYILLKDKKNPEQTKASTPTTTPETKDNQPKTKKQDKSAEAEEQKDVGKALRLEPPKPIAARPAKPGTRVSGPTIPEPTKGDILLAKAEAHALVPGPADKLNKVVINKAGSMAIAMYRSFDGFAGKGVLDTCERFALPSGTPAGKVEIPSDGVGVGRPVGLAQDGSKLAIEGPPGNVGIWDLNDETKKDPDSTFEPFPPEKGKPVTPAAIYFLDETRVVVVGPMGQVVGYDTAKKEKTIEGPALLTMPEVIQAGRNVTITPDGKMLVIVANGKLFEIPTTTGRTLGGVTIFTRTHTILATAVDPAGARVLVAYQDDSGIRVGLYPAGADKAKASFVFPTGIGMPTRAAWLGNDIVVISVAEDAGAVIFDAEIGRWTAYVRRPGKPDPLRKLQVQDPEKDWHLAHDDAGKLRLLAVEWPFDSYFSERDLSTKGVMSLMQTAEGLKR